MASKELPARFSTPRVQTGKSRSVISWRIQSFMNADLMIGHALSELLRADLAATERVSEMIAAYAWP